MVDREENGGTRVNRPASEGVKERERKKILGKETWMKTEKSKEEASRGGGVKKRRVERENRKGKEGEKIEGVIFVPVLQEEN